MSKPTFKVRCPHCGHTSEFNKITECGPDGVVLRRASSGGKRHDVLLLECQGCKRKLQIEVNCEGYR